MGLRPTGIHRLAAALPALSIALASFAGAPIRVSANTTSPPQESHSWYPQAVDQTTMTNLGTISAQQDATGCQDNLDVLYFGQIDNEQYTTGDYNYAGYGVRLQNSGARYPFAEDDAIYWAAIWFAKAWYAKTTSCPRLKLALGVNNYHQCPYGNANGECDPTTAGREWGQLVADVYNYLSKTNSGSDSTNMTWQISVWAADDIEGGCSIYDPNCTSTGWDCFPQTNQFVGGFDANNPSTARLLDDGTVEGSCRTDTHFNGSDVDWTDNNFWQVAYGWRYDWPLPEIYNTATAQDWGRVKNRWYMYFMGPMSVRSASYTSSQAWWDLWNYGGASSPQGTLDYATTIGAAA